MKQFPLLGYAASAQTSYFQSKFSAELNVSIIYDFRSIDFFLKKGLVQKDSQKRMEENEEQRKLLIELVLKEIYSQNTRPSNRKATSVLQ